MKDPAFLFYTKDFYEGTRMMLPEERACYLDLLMYQHQNGPIPNNPKRLSMYCSGIDEATLIATLEAKFKLTDKGWVNRKLESVINERKEFTDKQSVNGQVGQFFKKAKAILNKKDYSAIRESLDGFTNDEKLKIIQENEALHKGSLEAMLKAMLKHLANEDVDADEDINKDVDKGGVGEKDLEVQFPFTGKDFMKVWKHWKDYKKKEFKFTYASPQSEQAALMKLANLSNQSEKTAIDIIMQSMENGWKGIFELKTDTNGNKNKSFDERLREAFDYADRIYGQ